MEYIKYEDLRQYNKDNNIITKDAYIKHVSLVKEFNNLTLPINPDAIYPEWTKWLIFLARTDRSEFVSYEELKKYTRLKKLTNKDEYIGHVSIKNRTFNGLKVPYNPYTFYPENIWEGWGIFLGYRKDRNDRKDKYISYDDFKKYIKTKKIKSVKQYYIHVNNKNIYKGKKIPFYPRDFYPNEIWEGWEIILEKTKIISYEGLKEYVKLKNLKTKEVYLKHVRKKNIIFNGFKIPNDPPGSYPENIWKTWGDLFGTGSVAPRFRKYLPFKIAREYARSLKLQHQQEWMELDIKYLPSNIPKSPRQTYKDEWIDWADWFGLDKNKRKLSYGEKMMWNIFTEFNVIFLYNKTFRDCKDKSKLKFDYRLPEYDNDCFEFDGMQHFIPYIKFGGIKALKNTQKKDKIKDEWCKKNGIRLFRFNYTQSYEEIRNAIIDILFPDPLSTNFPA